MTRHSSESIKWLDPEVLFKKSSGEKIEITMIHDVTANIDPVYNAKCHLVAGKSYELPKQLATKYCLNDWAFGPPEFTKRILIDEARARTKEVLARNRRLVAEARELKDAGQ